MDETNMNNDIISTNDSANISPETPAVGPIPDTPILEDAPAPDTSVVEPNPVAPILEDAPSQDILVVEPSPYTPIPDTPAVELIPDESIPDTPAVELIPDESIPDTPALETNNEIDEIQKQFEMNQLTKSQSSSNLETLGDSTQESITNSLISNTTIATNLENNIINIVEPTLETFENTDMDNTDLLNQVITETNFNTLGGIETTATPQMVSLPELDAKQDMKTDTIEIKTLETTLMPEVERTKIPEPEIIELDKIPSFTLKTEDIDDNTNINTLHKSNVSFSRTDLNDIIGISSISNQLGNAGSLNTASEFSYTKIIKNTRQPDLTPKPSYKNIRICNPSSSCGDNFNKKKQKKQIELDDIDYLYNKLQDYSRYLTINITNYMVIITKAMEIIENYDNFSPSPGYGKKEVVVKAINRLVMIDLELGEFDKKMFLSTLSNFIELIIMCSKRHTKDSRTSTKDNFASKNDKIDEMVLASCGQIVFSLIDKLTTIIIKNQYNAEKIIHNIPTITEILMLMADKYDYLTGFEKKNIVFQAMNIFIRDKLEHVIDLDQDKKHEIIETLQCVPSTIDLFIALQKQKYKINKKRIIKVRKSGCLSSIFGTKKSYDDD